MLRIDVEYVNLLLFIIDSNQSIIIEKKRLKHS